MTQRWRAWRAILLCFWAMVFPSLATATPFVWAHNDGSLCVSCPGEPCAESLNQKLDPCCEPTSLEEQLHVESFSAQNCCHPVASEGAPEIAVFAYEITIAPRFSAPDFQPIGLIHPYEITIAPRFSFEKPLVVRQQPVYPHREGIKYSLPLRGPPPSRGPPRMF